MEQPRPLARTPCRSATDPRLWQIAVLSGLLVWNIAVLSLGASLLPSLAALAGALSTQAVLSRLAGLPRTDLKSALITGLSLSLLLRTDALWLEAAAGVLAIGSKFLIRVDHKPLVNPAAFAILALLATGHGWVSPGQWGQSLILASAMLLLGLMVLQRAARLDTALAFAAVYAGLLVWRAVRLGDPLAIPLHQVQSGALVLFCCFMITDPRTTPETPVARLVFAAVVAVVAHWLVFARQMPSGLYLSLTIVSLLVPILDRLLPARMASRPHYTERPA